MEETLDQTDSIRELALNRSQHLAEPVSTPAIPGYRFEVLLGTGSFGQVWAARQMRTGLEVAVKIFTRPAGLDWDYLRQEVSRLTRVAEHPHVVSLLDAGLDQSPPFFVMRRYGGSLTDWRREHPDAPLKPILQWWKEVGEALAYTHSKGLLHCDLKPSNILLDAEQRAILGDFGQSVARGTGGTHFGSLGYMAPEQAGQLEEGFGTPDVRWDIYALGATVYFLLCGQLPRLSNDTLQEIGSLVGTAEKLSRYRFELAQRPLVPVRKLRPDLDAELAHLLEACVALNPAHRPQSASDLLLDLERCRQGQPLFCRRPWSAGYRARRFLARNLLPVALTAVIAGVTVFSVGERWVEQTALQAQGDFEKGMRDLNDGRAGSAAQRWARSLQIQPRQTAPAWLIGQEPARLEFLKGVGDALNGVGFSADGNLLFASGEKGTQVFDLRTNEPRGPKLGSSGQRNVDVRAAYGDNPPAAFLLGGERLLTLTDKSQLWNLGTGEALPLDLPAGSRVSCSADGKKLLFMEKDGVVLVDSLTGSRQKLRTSARPRRAALSADGESVAIGHESGAVELLLPQRKVLGHHPEPVEMLAFSPDGKSLASSPTDQPPLCLWNVDTGERQEFKIGSWGVYGISFSPNGKQLAVSFYDGATALWTLGDPTPKILRHHWLNYGATFSADGRYLATYSVDGTARVWETSTGRPVSPFLEHSSPVKAVAFRPGPQIQDGMDVATACEDGTLRLFRISLKNEPILSGRPGRNYAAEYSPDGSRLAVAREATDRSGSLHIYDTSDPSKAPVLVRNYDLEAGCHTLAWTRDGGHVVCGCSSGDLLLCSASEERQSVLQHPKVKVDSVVTSPDGSLAATACDDGVARTVSLPDGKVVAEIKPQGKDQMHSVEFSPDGRQLLTTRDNHADLWNLADGSKVRSFEHNGVIRTASFSPDGKRVATASLDRTARIWNAETGEALSAPLRHDLSVVNVHFSPDGSLLATASADGQARLWNAATGHLAAPGLRQRGPVWNAVFSPDGKLVATCSKTGAVQLYDVQGRPVLAPIQHSDFAYSVSFRPDGRGLVTSSWDGSIQWRELKTPPPVNVAQLTRLVEKRTGLRLEIQMGQCVVRPLTPEEWAKI
jgi:WD40 repeat protein